jgi:ABC-type branched-subunit amino acid transport system substrate-binding protein
VVLAGTASAPCLPSFGQDVFNDVAVSDSTCDQPILSAFDAWYKAVSQLRSDRFWRQHTYQNRFGVSPAAYADLFYDAASVMLDKITHTAKLAGDGGLVIDRTLLAHAVRATTNFKGVTGNITLMANGFRVNTLARIHR